MLALKLIDVGLVLAASLTVWLFLSVLNCAIATIKVMSVLVASVLNLNDC